LFRGACLAHRLRWLCVRARDSEEVSNRKSEGGRGKGGSRKGERAREKEMEEK